MIKKVIKSAIDFEKANKSVEKMIKQSMANKICLSINDIDKLYNITNSYDEIIKLFEISCNYSVNIFDLATFFFNKNKGVH